MPGVDTVGCASEELKPFGPDQAKVTTSLVVTVRLVVGWVQLNASVEGTTRLGISASLVIVTSSLAVHPEVVFVTTKV